MICEFGYVSDEEAISGDSQDEAPPSGRAIAQSAAPLPPPPNMDVDSDTLLTTSGMEIRCGRPARRFGTSQFQRPVLQQSAASRGKSWIYAEIPTTELESVYKFLRGQRSTRGALVASIAPGICAALLCRSRSHRDSVLPTGSLLYGLPRGGGSADMLAELLRNLLAESAECYGDLELRAATAHVPLDMEAAVEALKRYSDEELTMMCGDARLKEAHDRSELEVVLLRCWGQIRAVRARRAAGGLVHEVALELPKPLALEAFMGLESLIGTLYDPVLDKTSSVTYAEYLRNPQLHLRYAACLLGAGGLGKTPLAKSTAVYFATAYQQLAYGTPAGRCYYIQSNSVDTLRACGHLLKPYVPIFIDEFQAADVRQQGFLGENGVKVLCDVPEGGTLRVRFGSIVFPQCCPRLFAANCANPEDWLQKLGTNASHLGAIRKRVVFFRVLSRIVPVGAPRSLGALDDPAKLQAALQQAQQTMRD